MKYLVCAHKDCNFIKRVRNDYIVGECLNCGKTETLPSNKARFLSQQAKILKMIESGRKDLKNLIYPKYTTIIVKEPILKEKIFRKAPPRKPIYIYDIYGNYISELIDMHKVCRSLEVSVSAIYQSCNILSTVANKFKFRYFKTELLNEEPKRNKNSGRAIEEYDKDGNLVVVYNDLADFIDKTGFNPSNASAYANGAIKRKGRIFKYKKNDK